MKAIHQEMKVRHAEDKARVNNLTNKDETEDHKDPSSPNLVHIDEGLAAEDFIQHPDSEELEKANSQSKQAKKPKKQGKPNAPPSEKLENKELHPKPKPRKGSSIPGEENEVKIDFLASQFPRYKKYNSPKTTPNSTQGIHSSFWNPKKQPKIILIPIVQELVNIYKSESVCLFVMSPQVGSSRKGFD
ncbi:hypothetical protein DSO57_1030608 [Entomophthora muscae]|uniref:Uncharacterized protein n=1 Tax=Entomophthora muscae TaxID=34485 RepID=A0ACC2SQ34_9FUNG|nr:hypothetical protein DSO57_1030608 [Entomophthora muscae]